MDESMLDTIHAADLPEATKNELIESLEGRQISSEAFEAIMKGVWAEYAQTRIEP
jgi:DNA-directed RNA polymerase subunit A"